MTIPSTLQPLLAFLETQSGYDPTGLSLLSGEGIDITSDAQLTVPQQIYVLCCLIPDIDKNRKFARHFGMKPDEFYKSTDPNPFTGKREYVA